MALLPYVLHSLSINRPSLTSIMTVVEPLEPSNAVTNKDRIHMTMYSQGFKVYPASTSSPCPSVLYLGYNIFDTNLQLP